MFCFLEKFGLDSLKALQFAVEFFSVFDPSSPEEPSTTTECQKQIHRGLVVKGTDWKLTENSSPEDSCKCGENEQNSTHERFELGFKLGTFLL